MAPKTILRKIYIPFRQRLLPGQGMRISQPTEATGIIRTIQCHWPDGCNALVGIAVWYGHIQILPKEGTGYLALNDVTPTYEVNQSIEGGQVWIDIYNQDAANPHTISVTVGIEAE